MAFFAFFLFAAAGGGGVVVLRERPKTAAAIGLLAAVACLLAAIAMPADASLSVGSTTLQSDAYVRLFLVAGTVALVVSQIAGLAHGWQRELPLATLGALGLVGVALTVGTPAAAMLTVAAAGTFAVIASLERAISMPAVRAAASGFRLAVVAGFMGLVAMAITGDDPIFVQPDVLAGATLLMAAAVAIRVGAIPVHAPVARLIERARTAALPLLAAWVPAAFAVVALGWTSTIVAVGATTPVLVVVVAVGVLTIALASAVVVIDDDLVRWLGYGVIADGGFVLLALAGNTTAAISAGLAWLICFALARSIMACVLLGLQGTFDARRTRELDGWLRRTPLLGLALLAALVVAFGLPGTLSWQVRLDLAQGALGEPLGVVLVAVALLPLVPVARLAWTGLRPLGDVVAAGRSERFMLPPRTAIHAGASAAEAQPATAAVSPSELTEAGAGSTEIAFTPVDAATAAVGDGSPEPGPDTLWAATNVGAAPEPIPEVGEAPAIGASRSSLAEPTSETVPVTTLSSSGRASRAARKASQPTIIGPAGPDTPVSPDAAQTDVAPREPGSTRPAARVRRASALEGLRRTGASASRSVGPVRHALRDLPAFWALDRTLVASLATLLLALVGLAFATDLVGLGAAAGSSAASTHSP